MKHFIKLLLTLLVASISAQASATNLYSTYYAYAESPDAHVIIACKCDNERMMYQTYLIVTQDGKTTITDNYKDPMAEGFMLYTSKDLSTVSDLIKHIKANGRRASTEITSYITLETDDSSIYPTNSFSRNTYDYFYKRLAELKSAQSPK